MAKVLQFWGIESDGDVIVKSKYFGGQRSRCEMTEIVSGMPFCRLQNSFVLSGQNDRGGTGTPMKEIIEEAIIKYLKIIEKQKKPKRVKKKKGIHCVGKRRKNREAKGTQTEEGR